MFQIPYGGTVATHHAFHFFDLVLDVLVLVWVLGLAADFFFRLTSTG